MRGSKSKSPPQQSTAQAAAAKSEAAAERRAGKKNASEKGAEFMPAGASFPNHPEGNRGSDYSVNALSKLLGYDRRTIDKALVGIVPRREEGKTKFYKLSEVEKALREKKSGKLKDQKLVEEIRKLRIANDKAEGLTVLKSKIIESVQRCMGPAATMLEQRLANEYPTAVVGMDVPQVRIYGKRLCDEIMAFLQNLRSEWTA